MFGHNDNRSDRRSGASDGMLTSDDNSAVTAALVGDMTASYPPTNLPTPTTAPAAPASSDSGVTSLNMTASDPLPQSVAIPASSAADTAHPDQLLDIKQQALQHLSPLVDHLEQSASDRFRTTMMMIQASDNAGLIKTAYDAALQIPDDKERAQALLDLINEINYFTQQNKTTGTTES
jgi:hypothetical protein